MVVAGHSQIAREQVRQVTESLDEALKAPVEGAMKVAAGMAYDRALAFSTHAAARRS